MKYFFRDRPNFTAQVKRVNAHIYHKAHWKVPSQNVLSRRISFQRSKTLTISELCDKENILPPLVCFCQFTWNRFHYWRLLTETSDVLVVSVDAWADAWHEQDRHVLDEAELAWGYETKDEKIADLISLQHNTPLVHNIAYVARTQTIIIRYQPCFQCKAVRDLVTNRWTIADSSPSWRFALQN